MSKLVKSFMLVRCSDPQHVVCESIRDKIFDQPETIEAYTTSVDVQENDKPFCVAATIVGTKEEISKAQRKIKNIKTNTLRVDEIQVY